VKILVIGRFYEEAFALFIAEELLRMGHTVMRFDPSPTGQFGGRMHYYANRLRSAVTTAAQNARMMTGRDLYGGKVRRLLHEAGDVDLVLSTHDYLTPADTEIIKAHTRAPLVLWYPDPVWSFRRHMFLNANYDILLFKDPYLVHMIRSKLGKRAFYMPECYSPHSLSPEMAAPPANPAYATDICIAGSLYAYRIALFRQLTDYDLKMWGMPAPPWLRAGDLTPQLQNRFVAHAEKVRAFHGAKIVLNTLNPSEIWGTNVRTFEACGAGAFQVVDWRPGLAQLFEIGTEVVAFGDIEDLRRKIDHYLSAPEERSAIAAAGHARVRLDHTYAIRLQQLLDTVAGKMNGYPEPQPAWTPPND
jgi:spore maturation protein CgeB